MTSSLIGSLVLGGGTNYSGSKKLMNHQSQLWRSDTQWLNENGWKYMRQGLINADYNPLLAIGSSPSSAPMASATATDGTMSVDTASGVQANTARKVGDSQIMVNKATASKTAEEAMTQQNVRSNLDSQSLLNLLSSERIQRLLPLDEQKAIADVAVANSLIGLNNANAAAAPRLAGAAEKQAQAAEDTVTINKGNKPWQTGASVIGALSGLAALYLTRNPNIARSIWSANGIKGLKTYKSMPNNYNPPAWFGH